MFSVEERDLDLNITSRYLHGSGVDDPLLLINKEGVFAYTKDGLGSIRELTPINTSAQVPYQRYRYSSYGVTSQMLEGVTQGRKLIENRYAYTGREIEDEVGLYYYRARYYDPELGRFISEDPIGFNGGDVNFYGYVGNSPVNFTDPSGLWGFGLIGGGSAEGGIGIIGGGVTGSVGSGIFAGGSRGVNAGGFAGAGAFAGGPGYGGSAPQCQNNQTGAVGAFAGAGAGLFLTNATSANDLSGYSNTYSFNIGVGPIKFSIQFGQSGNIWIGYVTVGPCIGLSGSTYPTWTNTTK